MKLKLFKTLILILLSTILFNSCKKYSEDDSTSYKTPKKRLSNEWTLTEILINGSPTVFALPNLTKVEFEKGGEYITTWSNGTTNIGTWEFSEKKTKIRTNLYGFEQTLSILKLTNSELKWSITYAEPRETWTYSFVK
jgi:hypothetical protein